MDLSTIGFDPKLAAHATASLPAYAAAFTVVKRMHFIDERTEMLIAMVATATLNAGVAMGGGTAPLFPALSTAAVGAMGAMITHALLFKKATAK